jgi:hypothetical protein
MVVKLEVKVVRKGGYKYRLGPGRVLPSLPVLKFNYGYQISTNTSY